MSQQKTAGFLSHLKLFKLSKGTRKIFELSGYDMYVETFDDKKTAVAAF